MTALLKNIIEYYTEEIMERDGMDKITAINLLEDALQNENIEEEIFNFISANKDKYK